MTTETAQIIQLFAPRSKGDKTGRKARPVLDTQKTSAESSFSSDTAENFRLRQDRYYDWREASAVMDYWRAAMKMKSAISCMQNYGTPEGDMYRFVKAEDHGALVAKWRLAWCKLMLTPAPNAREVTWKRAQLEAENWKYAGLSAKRIEQAIADDVEWLTAHPTRQSRKRDQEQ